MRRGFIVLLTLFVIWIALNSRAEESGWLRLVRDPVVLHCHKSDLSYGKEAMEIVEDAIPRIQRDLRLPTVGRITVVIAPSDKKFHNFTRGQIPEWGIGAADPHNSIIFLKSPRFSRPQAGFRKVVIHELSHVMLGMVLRGMEVDRWFDEGFALYESGERGLRRRIALSKSLVTGDVLQLDEIDDVLSFHRIRASQAYEESLSAVEYLVEHNGRAVLADIAWALSSGMNMDEALKQSAGITFHDFQKNWYQDLRRRYRWYILLDFPLVISSIFLILFFLALYMARRRVRQKKHIWEQEALNGLE